jgi:S-DNA-T family DNA segregation ATPase FtsK/SpoIIIE
LLNVILAGLSGCRDVTLWGIDLKQGMELRPWARCLDQLATTNEHAEAVLDQAVLELDQRAASLAEQGRRVWTPTPDNPALVIIIDEYAELSPEARALADSIARRGRAVAVTLIVATQRPTAKAMGEGSAVRSQMDIRICLRVRERRDVDLILGQGALAAGWDATVLDAPGKFLLSAPDQGHTRLIRARAYLITDDQVAATADRHARHDPPPPPTRQTGRADHTASMGRPGEPDPPSPQRPLSRRRQGRPDRRAVGHAEGALWAALAAAPEHGVSLPELMAACGQGRRWVYYRLRQLAADGRIQRTAPGRWRATDTGPDGSPQDASPNSDGDGE